MISLSGYSSTTTSTLKKKDVIEKPFIYDSIVMVAVEINVYQLTSVEKVEPDIGLTEGYINNKIEIAGNVPDLSNERITLITAYDPPPLQIR